MRDLNVYCYLFIFQITHNIRHKIYCHSFRWIFLEWYVLHPVRVWSAPKNSVTALLSHFTYRRGAAKSANIFHNHTCGS